MCLGQGRCNPFGQELVAMRFRVPLVIMGSIFAAGIAAVACYRDDIPGPPRGKPLARVLLTDAPFPFDSVASVNLYVVSVEAATTPDTGSRATWTTVAEPHRTFNLLAVQQGATAFVGEGELPVGQYRAIRMTIDVDSSSVLWGDGTRAQVDWGAGRWTLYAWVQPPFSVGDAGADIVLDFDVGLSFPYDLFGDGHFAFGPWLRAVNSAATGAIAGTVTTDYTGTTTPLRNASITVYAGGVPTSTSGYPIVATGHSDGTGQYRVAFLPAGTYGIVVTAPYNPYVASVSVADVQITAGATVTESVTLPAAGAGSAYIHIAGPTTVGVGGSIWLQAAVVDSNGNPVQNPSVTWTSSDTSVATSSGVGAVDSVQGRSARTATITAMSLGMRDSIAVTVIRGVDTVVSVTVSPPTVDAAVGDSLFFTATPHDTSGAPLYGRPIAWFLSDTTIASLYPSGAYAL